MAFAILITVLLLMCACSNKESAGEIKPFENTAAANEMKKQSKEIKETHPVEYDKKIIKINGRENHVFIMKIDISDESVSVLPYLSFGKIYGFETLSDMAKKTKAYAAVTGGFFFQYGVPSGLVVNSGEIISPGKGRFKSLIIEDGKARFETVITRIYININGTLIEMDRFNEPAEEGDIALYSDAYGVTDRLKHMRDVFYIHKNRGCSQINTYIKTKCHNFLYDVADN